MSSSNGIVGLLSDEPVGRRLGSEIVECFADVDCQGSLIG